LRQSSSRTAEFATTNVSANANFSMEISAKNLVSFPKNSEVSGIRRAKRKFNMKVLNVVGARPNFMKIAPIVEEMKKARDLDGILVHTGQHYGEGMSDVFFRELGIPVPDVHLGVGSGSHAEQTARIMVEFEKVCLREKPDLVLVVGDV